MLNALYKLFNPEHALKILSIVIRVLCKLLKALEEHLQNNNSACRNSAIDAVIELLQEAKKDNVDISNNESPNSNDKS